MSAIRRCSCFNFSCLSLSSKARAPGSPVVIVGTHCDKIRGEEREKRKVELNRVIYEKYLVGRGPQQLRELGLPRILDVMYVGCPPGGGRGEGVAELRKALYSIAFSLTVLRSEWPSVFTCTVPHAPKKPVRRVEYY